jgi:PAS domain S-box-containing protein
MNVLDYTSTDIVSLTPSSTMREALQGFLELKQDIACVTDGGFLIGIVTKYSIYRSLLSGFSLDSDIQSCIKKEVITLFEGDSLVKAQNILIKANIGNAVVLNAEGKVTGVMTKANLLHALSISYTDATGHLQLLLETLQDNIISVNNDLEIVSVNKAFTNLFQLSTLHIIGEHIAKITPTLTEKLEQTLTTQTIQEEVIVKLNHSSLIASFLPIKQHGNIVGAMAVLRDVTAYERVSKELESTKQLERTLDSALELSYDGILITNNVGQIMRANKGILELYKYDRLEEIVGKNINEVAPEISVNQNPHESANAESELIKIHNNRCLITQMPIYRNMKKTGVIIKVIFKQLNQWKDLFFHMEKLENEITTVREQLAKLTSSNSPLSSIISVSKKMEELKKEALVAAKSSLSILITGESGTGKGVFADAIHQMSGRKGNFIKVNCAAIPEDLLESEFFGYVDGAFTGAKKGGKPGKFELADNGTLFLDEIGELPLSLQAKLLRVLQDNEFERIGDTKTRKVDVRIITATNRDLKRLVQEKKFREDLYYRIDVIHLHLPSLSERTEDIPLLCHYLIKNISMRTNKSIYGIRSDALNFLKNYSWEGNIRQLENVLERAVHFCNGEWIETRHLPEEIIFSIDEEIEEAVEAEVEEIATLPIVPPNMESGIDHSERKRVFEEFERKDIFTALTKAKGNKTKAAELLGISRATLYQKIKKHNITEVSNFVFKN